MPTTEAGVQPLWVSSRPAQTEPSAHDGADGEVDAGDQDDVRHADRDEPGDRDLPQHVGQVAVGQEDVAAAGGHGRERDAEREDREQAPVELALREHAPDRGDAHAARLGSRRRRRTTGVASRMIASSLASARADDAHRAGPRT